MTGQRQASACARIPTLFRESTAVLMKVTYQQHMLYGIAVAVTVVLLPALLASYWPMEQADMIEVSPVPPRELPLCRPSAIVNRCDVGSQFLLCLNWSSYLVGLLNKTG